MQNIEYAIDEKGVARVTLNNPKSHNAFNDHMIKELTAIFLEIQQNAKIRVMVLSANGKSFCAGADAKWMKKMVTFTHAENKKDANKLATMLHSLYTLNKPTIARVHGAAFGGGVGLIACCDIAIGSRLSKFCLSEVRLGLIPATISPYIVKAIGEREAKRLFMTAEVISSRRARRLGLLSENVSESELDATIDSIIERVFRNGPKAVSAAKQLALEVVNRPIDEKLKSLTSSKIADIRASQEGQEGLNAFLEKRPPDWVKG